MWSEIKHTWKHRNHLKIYQIDVGYMCSIYAPCRKADLQASWEAYKRRVDNPETREMAIMMELDRQRKGWEPY